MSVSVHEDPLILVSAWLDEAKASADQPNPTSMTLATVGANGRPSARVVLLKSVAAAEGFGLFYTNHASRKARELQDNYWAAGVLHWDRLGRQIRLEGAAVRAPDAESDAYFATRPWRSQVNAWASRQSEPLEQLADLERAACAVAQRFGLPDPSHAEEPDDDPSILPRPVFWGGYRFWFGAIELWATGANRFHERVRYERALSPKDRFSFEAGPWSHTRLQP
jgi:pyridoxamine 5'-phosphate oxidase